MEAVDGISAGMPVVVAFDRNLKSGRDIVAGIYRYAGQTRDWELFFMRRDAPQRELVDSVRRLGPAGLLADGELARHAPDLARRFPEMPIVIVDGLPPSEVGGFASVQFLCDDKPISEAAARLLALRGYRHFGFVGTTDEANLAHSRSRERTFRRQISAIGGTFSSVHVADAVGYDKQANLSDISPWLAKMPKPCGIMAYNDNVAQSVAETCRKLGIAVPDGVGIVGVDDDAFICENSSPTLTSIHPDFEDAGFRAAGTLASLISGGRRPTRMRTIRYGMDRLVERLSTQNTAGRRARVASAMEAVRLQATKGLAPRDIAKSLGVTLRTLEMDFAATESRTLRDCLVEARIDAAMRIAGSGQQRTNMEIALAAGFRTESAMRSAFRSRFGKSVNAVASERNSRGQ